MDPTTTKMLFLFGDSDINKNINEDVNEGEFVTEDVNDCEIISDEFANEISVVRKFPRKGNKVVPSITEHALVEISMHIFHDIDDNVKINEHVVK
ncbi:hypothetical protein RYX36_022883, partial [Vicia faba]